MRKFFSFLLICVFLSATAVLAQDEGKIIITMSVKNNKAVSEATILSKIKSKPGDKFNREILDDDLKRLYALGYFTDVSMDVEDYEEGVMIAIIVEEKPMVDGIVFEGNKKISARRLQKDMKSKKGEMLNYSLLSQDVNELKALYSRYGFQRVEINYEIEKDDETNTAVIKIVVQEKQRVRIKSVAADGNKAVKTKTLLDMMKTKAAWLFIQRGYFDEETFEADIEKLTRYYQSLGYLDAVVTADFKYDEKQEWMFIALHVNEGALYKTGSIKLEGNLVFPEEDVRKKIQMKAAAPFSYGDLRRDMDDIRDFYYEKGYMNVDIDVDRRIIQETNTIDLVYSIEARDVVYVGMVDIKGNIKTKDIVIRRELRLYPGEKYDGAKLKRSKERLYNLGFFEDVYFDTLETSKPDVRDLAVSVKETKTGEFAFGGGYSSVNEFIGFAQITQRNFDLFNFPYFTGDGQNLSVSANIGNIIRDFEISWTEPWIFNYPVSFGMDGYHKTHTARSAVGYGYKEVRAGGDARLGKEFGEYFRTDLMYKLENVNISDLPVEATDDLVKERGDNWISSLLLMLSYDTRDNIYSPKKGYLAQLIMEDAGGIFFGDKDYYKGSILMSYFYPFFYEKLILELKGRVGAANGYGHTDDVPIYNRFYAGGANTIRGYGERRVGPRDPGSNAPIGGESMAIGNIELTFPIYEKIIKGAVFYDVGNVWDRMEGLFQGGFKQGMGAGIRVKTPIGPLSLDCGYPLNDNHDDDKKLEWYFSVSHGF